MRILLLLLFLSLPAWASEPTYLEKARAYGTAKHAEQAQLYAGHPYEFHLERVEEVLTRFNQPEHLKVAAWLHDVVEDTPTTLAEIEAEFGSNIAGIVSAVTKLGDKCATIMNVLSHPDGVLLKLADRIANVEQGIRQGGILPKYKKDYPLFRSLLKQPGIGDAMWNHLDSLLK